MSLYHEAAEILLTAKNGGGSLKSIVFGRKTWKSDGKTLFALTSETSKWSSVLSEVIDASGLLQAEKTLSPILTILLAHDLLLSKRGIALPSQHGLYQALNRHKARLIAEFTKARIRCKCASIDDFRAYVERASTTYDAGGRRPRWVRINAVKCGTIDHVLTTAFKNYEPVTSLNLLMHAPREKRVYYVDKDIDFLIAISGPDDPTTFKEYKDGLLILQDKASCFPAHLLDHRAAHGDAIDACAAPGNKTTHLAAIMHHHYHRPQPTSRADSHATESPPSRIFACEKDSTRAATLTQMVRRAGCGGGGEKDGLVTVRAGQDFLRLRPADPSFARVTALLLDPSCSGSGIMGRDEVAVEVKLPGAGGGTMGGGGGGRKRKRGGVTGPKDEKKEIVVETAKRGEVLGEGEEEVGEGEETDARKRAARLAGLAKFQLRVIEHAMAFPAATRITYSTCSVHIEENEAVVLRALGSDVARDRGWQILPRKEQVRGMNTWPHRGLDVAQVLSVVGNDDSHANYDDMDLEEVVDSCIRCEKGGDDGTMGFFVAAFARGRDRTEFLPGSSPASDALHDENGTNTENGHSEEEEWHGFSEDEA